MGLTKRLIHALALVLCLGAVVEASQRLVASPPPAIVVVNFDTGEYVHTERPTAVVPIASLTKIMTALVVLNAETDLDTQVRILIDDVRKASTTYLRANDRVSVRNLLYLMIVGSDNAAARALARVTHGSVSAFVRHMNQTAEELELSETHFSEPTGLSARNVSSADNIVRLLVHAEAQAAITMERLFNMPIWSVHIGRRVVTVTNTNRQIDETVVASKTGFTNAARYCLTLLVSTNTDTRYAIVILGAPNSKERFRLGEHFKAAVQEFIPDVTQIVQRECGPQPQTISDAGKSFIRANEALRLRPYSDAVGYAVGYGMHTWQGRKVTRHYPTGLYPELVEEEFDLQLVRYSRIVNTYVCAPLTQPMYDALVSMTWNLGRINTTILRKFAREAPISPRDFLSTATVHRRAHAGLAERRLREYLVFTGDYDAAMRSASLRDLRKETRGRLVFIRSAE